MVFFFSLFLLKRHNEFPLLYIHRGGFEAKFTQLLKNGYCLLVGTCGRWNGSVRGGKFIASFDDLYNAIQHLDYYLKQSKKEDKYLVEKQEIKEIFETNKARYGYRRILAVLRQKGYIINHKTVLRLMKSLNLQAK